MYTGVDDDQFNDPTSSNSKKVLSKYDEIISQV